MTTKSSRKWLCAGETGSVPSQNAKIRDATEGAVRAKVFSEAVADDFEDGRVIHESMESFCPGSTADNDDIFRRIKC
jgi:hypothetical protein